jgi:hypothetical protein
MCSFAGGNDKPGPTVRENHKVHTAEEGRMSQNQQSESDQQPESESKGWWQTLPGLLTAGAAILTAFTGLLVALNQMGLFHRAHAPASAQSATSVSAPSSDSQAPAEDSASVPLTLPANASLQTGTAVYTLLAARVSPYAPGQVTLDLTIRMTNRNSYDANFWAASFRLAVNGALVAPSNDLDELVPANSAKEAEVDFVIPANIATAGLEMGDVGPGKPALVIQLSNPQ